MRRHDRIEERLGSVGCTVLIAASLAACGGVLPEGRAEEPPPPEPARVTVALRLVEAPRRSEDALASTRILLVDIDEERGRRTTDVGTYAGICTARDPEPGALLEVECFGSGARVVVRESDDRLEVWRYGVDPDGGRTEPELAGTVTLPERARVEALGVSGD